MAAVASNLCSLDGVDDASASLILELQLADIDTMQAQLTGKTREGEHTDVEFALLLLHQNLDDLRSIIYDRRMTQSIADAVQIDGDLVAAAALEEEVACGDHALAHRFNGSDVVSEVRLQKEVIEDQLLSKLAGTYLSEGAGSAIFDPCEEEDASGEPSSRRGKENEDKRRLNSTCVACREPKKYFDVIAGPCRHEYCRECVRELFESSLTDESLFPPRCCRRPITIDSVSIFLTRDLKERFEQKKIEFSTPNRTYCCNPTCSAFIRMSETHADAGTCGECGVTTCTICKSSGHPGECPSDTALQAVVDLANEENWQRCYNCRRVVELDVGCNHITCRCGAQFCYVCGSQWKTCGCDQWDEQNLLARAHVLVDRGPEPERIEDRVVQVEEAAQMLRERHNCEHTGWRYIQGANQCEECRHILPQYIFECRNCQIRACNRCRRNRL